MDSSGFAAALQDSAAALYHNNINPLLQRCATYMAQPNTEPSIPSLAMQQDIQHSDNLKWQQDMFHRLLHLLCLSKEGLASQQQITSCKRQVLTFLESTHPNGEWPEFTRDKLLFLQDLLFVSCISESEYHAAKKPLILRLADQGAIIDAEDFIFDSSTSSDAKVMRSKSMARTPSTKRAKARSMAESDISRTPTRTPTRKTDIDANTKGSSTSPLKQVVGAVCRFNRTPSHERSGKLTDGAVKTEKESSPLRVPHALDFLRPEHCPIRDPPSPYQASPHQAYQRNADSSVYHVEQVEAPSVIEPAPAVDNFKDGDVCNWFTSPSSSPKASPKTNAVAEAIDPLLGHASPAHSSKSPGGGTPSRFRNVLAGLIQKKTMQQPEGKKNLLSSKKQNAGGEEKTFSISKSSKWGLDILRFPKKLQFDQEDNPAGNPNKPSCDTDHGISEGQLLPLEEKRMHSANTKKLQFDHGISEGQLLPLEEKRMHSPNTKKLKKQVLSKDAQPDFFIDKVLGENIKNELSRIRTEMSKAQPGQTFSNEQIDAIATKLPMDKAELKKFFPQTWCEKYGEIVLDVVQKEFKEHVGEMQKLGKGSKGKQQLSALSSSSQNDENMEVSSPHHKQQLPRRTPDFSKCFTTLDENAPAKSTTISWGSSPKKQPQSGSTLGSPKSPNVEKSKCKLSLQHRYSRNLTSVEDNLDRKLEEEIMKMPLRWTNDHGSHLRA